MPDKKMKYAHYSVCELYGALATDPEFHEGIHDDGHVVLWVRTTNGFHKIGEDQTVVRCQVPEGYRFETLEEEDEVLLRGWLGTDKLERQTLYPKFAKGYRDREEILEFDIT